MKKTYLPTKETVERKWYVVDAKDQVLGHLASQVAAVLRGKHKPEYTPSVDCGDYVIVINASEVKVTGGKEKKKMYKHHTGYPGGLREVSFEELLEKHPERPIEIAVKGMLPIGPLGRQMFKKLRVYPGPDHNHDSQLPEKLEF